MGQSPRGQPLLEGDIGQQVERPGTLDLAEAPRGLVEDAPERVGLGLVEDRSGVLGAAFLLTQAALALVLEGVDGVANGADRAPDPGRDLGRPMALVAGEQDLGATERERLSAPEPGLEGPTLDIGESSNEQRWFHDPLFGPTTTRTRN